MKRWTLVLLTAGVLMGITGRAKKINADGGGYSLSISTNANRDGAVALQGANLSGSVYVFTSSSANLQNYSLSGLSGLCYWLDNPGMAGTATHCEAAVPYDFAGTTGNLRLANPWDTSRVPNGPHTITQLVRPVTGATETDTATFTVCNGTACGTSGQPGLSTVPRTVSFGSVVVGSPNTQAITLTNSGTANLSVSQAAVSGNGFALSGLTVPLTLAPGQSASFNVAFSPVGPGDVTGGISLVSNAPNSPTNIPLSGTGIAATLQLTASPTSLSFGNVTVGSSAMQAVALTNTGNSSVSISSIGVPLGFLTSGLATTLAAGQTATFSVTFAPTSAGSVIGSASVISNASNAVTIALTGSGVQPIAHTATLTWSPSASVVTGYNIYRGSVSGGPYVRLSSTAISATSYVDSTVQSGQTYFYVVTAVDSNNLEGVYSNEASAVTPTP